MREQAGCRFVTAEHTRAAGPTRVVTTAVDIAELPDAIGAVGALAADVAEQSLVADLYLTWEDQPTPRRWRSGLAGFWPNSRCRRAYAGSPPPWPAPAAR